MDGYAVTFHLGGSLKGACGTGSHCVTLYSIVDVGRTGNLVVIGVLFVVLYFTSSSFMSLMASWTSLNLPFIWLVISVIFAA